MPNFAAFLAKILPLSVNVRIVPVFSCANPTPNGTSTPRELDSNRARIGGNRSVRDIPSPSNKQKTSNTAPAMNSHSAKQTALRWTYCEFLKEVGMKLKVPQLTIATAIVFCHKFYASQAAELSQSDLHAMATSCMFLAGKVEETPKSINDLLRTSIATRYKGKADKVSSLLQDVGYLQEQKELVLRAERLLLHTLAFEFNIEHPYKYLLSTVKQMQSLGYISEDCTRQLAQIAWNFANDSLRTTICLRHSAKDCAFAVIYLATKFMGTKLKLPENWCAKLKMEESISEEISNHILDLYENTNVKEKNNFAHISPENNT